MAKKNTTEIAGYIAFESCDDFEQALALDVSQGLPPGGLLIWSGSRGKPPHPHVFDTRAEAREAIEQTEHYRRAFGSGHPEGRFCWIAPVRRAVNGGDA